jgi:hypothetical protein
MYFSYCIKYGFEKHWTTGKVDKSKNTLTNKQGVTMPLDMFLKYTHHYHDEELTEDELNSL